jgi:hypothetical protein
VLLATLLARPSALWADKVTDPAVERDVVEVAAPEGVSIATVRIDNRLGNVTIHGHDSESIKIQSFKRAANAETLERLVVSLVPDAYGRVQVTTALRAGAEYKLIDAESIAVDLVVYVPRHSAVEAEIWKGNLEVNQIDSGAKLLVDKGRIQVKQVSGRVESALRKGEQDFAEVFGDLDARGIEGALRLRTIQGKTLVATLVRGKIDGEGLQVSDMTVRSVFGDIELMTEFVAGGRYSVTSRRGDVSLRFHGQIPVLVKVLAKSAMIGPDMDAAQSGEGMWAARYGKSKTVRPAQLEVHSGTGSVLVKHF